MASNCPFNTMKANPGNDWILPEDVVRKTIDKYLQAYEMLTGKPL